MGMKDMDRKLSVVVRELEKHGHKFNVVYDIGANDGRFMSAWKPVFSNSQWICMEANPKNHNKYHHQMNENDMYFHNVLSDENDKTVRFYSSDNGDTTGDSYYKELTRNYNGGKYQELTTKTLNTVIEERSLPLPDFIKMDTQGSELDIIRGGSKAFEHAKLVMIETPTMLYNEGAPKFSDYIDLMYENGFIPTGIEHIAMRINVVGHMDVVFVKSDINNEMHGHRGRYLGFQ